MTVMTNRGLNQFKRRVKFGVDVDAVVVSDGIGYSAEAHLGLLIYIHLLITLVYL